MIGDNAVTFGAFACFLLFVVARDGRTAVIVPYDPLASDTAQAPQAAVARATGSAPTSSGGTS